MSNVYCVYNANTEQFLRRDPQYSTFINAYWGDDLTIHTVGLHSTKMPPNNYHRFKNVDAIYGLNNSTLKTLQRLSDGDVIILVCISDIMLTLNWNNATPLSDILLESDWNNILL